MTDKFLPFISLVLDLIVTVNLAPCSQDMATLFRQHGNRVDWPSGIMVARGKSVIGMEHVTGQQ